MAGPTVLIVDDDADTADVLAQVVESGGFTPLVAYTVAQAIELAAGVDDLAAAVLDLKIRAGTGFTVAEALLRRARPPRLIAVTGLSPAEGCPIEFDAYLTKPSCCREIREVVAAAVARWCAQA
jgi:CheY-like chemotaxis protein